MGCPLCGTAGQTLLLYSPGQLPPRFAFGHIAIRPVAISGFHRWLRRRLSSALWLAENTRDLLIWRVSFGFIRTVSRYSFAVSLTPGLTKNTEFEPRAVDWRPALGAACIKPRLFIDFEIVIFNFNCLII